MTKLTIVSRRDGFRRAGRPWSVQPTTVDASEFTAEQLDALRADPMLVVSESGPPAIEDPAEREERIRAAFADLDPENPDHFTKSGKPDLAALRDRSGLADLAAAERDRQWKAAQAEDASAKDAE